MSINDDAKLGPVSSTVDTLRGELKAWEKAFANANEGRKAGREDIKKDPEIGMPTELIIHSSDRPNPRQRRSTETTPSSAPAFPARTLLPPHHRPLPHYRKSANYLLSKISTRALFGRLRFIKLIRYILQPLILLSPHELSVTPSPRPINARPSDLPLRKTGKFWAFSISSPRSLLRSIRLRPSGYLS